MISTHCALRLYVPALVLALLPAVSVAHEDDPKTLDRQPAFQGPGVRTLVPPGSGAWDAGTVPSFPQDGVQLLSWVTLSTLGGSSAHDCWGYTSPSGREYAIITIASKTAFVEITDPRNPVVLPSVNGPSCGWRDVKMYGSYAYIVSECGPGIQVVDLSNIDSGVVQKVNEVNTGGQQETHNVAINTESGYLYRTGGGNHGLRIYDLNADPVNPPFVGSWNTKYVHDAQIVSYTSGPAAGKEVAYCCSGFNNGWTSTGLTILDVTDKSNVVVMKEVFWGNAAYSHQAWLSPDRQYLYLNDEIDEQNSGLDTTTYVMDVADPDNAFLVGSFTNGKPAIGHNLYTRDDLVFEANYRSGLRVFDATNPTSPTEVAFFDTYELNNGQGFNGMWSNYPYFPSGVVIGSDMEKGLFVFWVGDPPLSWSWPNGEPTSSSSLGQSFVVQLGEQSPGQLVGGTETLHYDTGTGFQTAPLTSLGGGQYQVTFPPATCGTTIQWYLTADSQNGLSWTAPVHGASLPYELRIATNASLAVADDMEVDAGWTTSGVTAGKFELGDPIGSTSEPYEDHTPAPGVNCWYTDATNNVNNGTATLTSPVYDLSSLTEPVIGYWRWFSNNQGPNPGTDTFDVEVTSDGTTWVPAEQVGPSGFETLGGWIHHQFKLSDFVAPSATVQIRFRAHDTGATARVEAAVDDLTIHDAPCGGTVNYCTAGSSASGCQAAVSATGTPSASAFSGFTLDAANVEGAKDALFFFGSNGRQANAWGSGSSFQCVAPPVKRGGLLTGVGTAGACDGSFSQDLNALWCSVCPAPLKNPGAGAQVQAQLWYRDPFNTSNQTTSLSDAIEFTVAP
jgi:choice-of-anchor B domain-containing protein